MFEEDLCELINADAPKLMADIENLYQEYFEFNNESQFYQLTKKIANKHRLSKIFPNIDIDLTDVKNSDGSRIDLYLEGI